MGVLDGGDVEVVLFQTFYEFHQICGFATVAWASNSKEQGTILVHESNTHRSVPGGHFLNELLMDAFFFIPQVIGFSVLLVLSGRAQ